MTSFEYKVIAAPRRIRKVKGVPGAADQFAHTLGEAINEQARQGWEYLRADVMMADEPRGFLRSDVTAEHTVLVFRRGLQAQAHTRLEPRAEAPPALSHEDRARGILAQRDQRAVFDDDPPASAPARQGPRLGPAQKP